MTYPAPQRIRYGQVIGAKLIVPVADEGYERGYNAMVQDEYEAAYMHAHGRVQAVWHWARRVRTWTRPMHRELIHGGEYRCETCERWHTQYPEPPADEILDEAGDLTLSATSSRRS